MLFLFKIHLLVLISLAGIPPITELAGKLFVTTEFAPTILFSPMVTFGIIATFSPIHTFFLIITGSLVSNILLLGGKLIERSSELP